MKCEKTTDRITKPEECDSCGSEAELTRYEHFGPGIQIDWLCPYCAVCFTDNTKITKSVASMLNLLEKRLKSNPSRQPPAAERTV